MRYLIAIPLPDDLAAILRQSYQEVYHQPLKIRFLHITLIPPFTVADSSDLYPILQALNQIAPYNTEFIFENPDVFTHQRTILHLPIQATNGSSILHDIYHQLLTALRSHIIIQTTDFKPNELPKFKPHLTLSYNFSSEPQAFTPPKNPFSLPQPQLFEELGPGLWTQSGHTP